MCEATHIAPDVQSVLNQERSNHSSYIHYLPNDILQYLLHGKYARPVTPVRIKMNQSRPIPGLYPNQMYRVLVLCGQISASMKINDTWYGSRKLGCHRIGPEDYVLATITSNGALQLTIVATDTPDDNKVYIVGAWSSE